MFDREWTKNDQENHCPEDGHSFRLGIAFTISTNQLHLQENDREGLKLFGIYWPSGKTGLLFQMFRCSWQFSVSKKSCSIYFPTGIQPWSWASASPRKIKNIRICMGKNLPFQKKHENERNSIKKKIFPLGAVKNILSRYSSGREEGTKTVEVRDSHSGLEIFAGLLRIDDFLYFAGTSFWNVQWLSGADYALVTGRGGVLWGLILAREGRFKPEGAVGA